MNYYLVQSHYFLIFFIIMSLTFSAVPFVESAFSDISDNYVKSQMKRIQGEMFFYQQEKASFKNSCASGTIGLLVRDLVQEHGKYVSCRTNKPIDSHMIVCTQLKSTTYNCVDSSGSMCEVAHKPNYEYECKNLLQRD